MMKKPGHQYERTVVFGFGAQGHAQALNLRDSGRPVSVVLRPQSKRILDVREAGLLLSTDAAAAAAEADIAALLIPDGQQPAFYTAVLSPHLPQGALLLFAHGFSLHSRHITPRADLDVALVAPMAQGATVRSDFSAGGGVPVLVAVAQNATGRARERAMAYARAISRTGPFIETTVAEEVETDLFAEQAVLCGGMPHLVRAAFETLVAAGYSPKVACSCCLRELRAIVGVMDEHGIAGLYDRISDTARFGALTRGPRVIDARVRETLGRLLADIRSGDFSREAAEEAAKGYPATAHGMKESRNHPIETAFASLVGHRR